MNNKFKLLFIPTLTIWSNFAAADAILFDFELTPEVVTPEESVTSASQQIVGQIGGIREADRTNSQTQLYNTLLYASTSRGSEDPAIRAQAETIYKAVSPKTNSANTIVSRKNPASISVKGIGKRLASLRRKNSRVSFLPAIPRSKMSDSNSPYLLSPGLKKANNANESGGLLDQRLSGFFSGNMVSSQQTETATEAGFDGNTRQFTAGADYRLNNKSFIGMALSYVNGEMSIDRNGGSLNNTANTLITYGSYNISPVWYVDATISSGQRSFEMKRKIQFTTATGSTLLTALSKPDSNFYSFSIGTGYDLNWSNGNDFSFLTSFNYLDTSINAFSETNAGGYNLAVSKQDIVSASLNAGISWRKAISASFGVLLPQISISWTQEFADKSDAINAHFIADPGNNAINYETTNKDLGYMNILLGLSAVFPHGLSGFLQYDTQQLTSDYQQDVFSIGLRQEF